MVYFYCFLQNGKAFNGIVQHKRVKNTFDLNKLIDEIYNNDTYREMNITKENSVIVSLTKL